MEFLVPFILSMSCKPLKSLTFQGFLHLARINYVYAPVGIILESFSVFEVF